MKRLLWLLFSVSAFATTTVTGHIQTLGTGAVTNGAFVRFWLRGCGGNQPRINGTAVIAPSQGGVFFFDIPASTGGAISGTIYSTRDATGLLGGDIECGGSTTSVWYGMQIFQAGKGGPEVAIHAKNSATLDISNVTPITTNPVVTSPTGDTTYARLDGGNTPFFGQVSFSNNVIANNIDGIVLVDGAKYSQADVFASANTIAATFGSNPGKVIIPPGSYSTATTLNCINNIEFSMAGVVITYTGSGNAISIKSIVGCKITGPLRLLGNRTSGTVGIYVGNPTAGVGLTMENTIQDVIIGDAPTTSSSNGFGIGVRVDGNTSGSGTYYNVFQHVSSNGNLNQGWLIKPGFVATANSNRCVGCTAVHNGGDGFQLDGGTLWTFTGIDSEANGAYGFNFAGTLTGTSANTIVGGDFEGNTTADFNFGSTNVFGNTVIGVNTSSTTQLAGLTNVQAGNNFYFPANSGISPPFSTMGFGSLISEAPHPAQSGTIRFNDGDFLAWRNHANSGDLTLTHDTSDRLGYNGNIVSYVPSQLLFTTAPTVASGFGTSPSIVNSNGTAVFEVNVGTGGTATSGVLTMPTANVGWSCQVTDMNTNDVTRETAFTTTSVTLTAASAWTASDKLLVNCGAF